MIALKVILEEPPEGLWPDLETLPGLIVAGSPARLEVAAVPHGMKSGKVAVMFRVQSVTGETMVFQTSLELLNAAVRAMIARHGLYPSADTK